MPPRLVLLVDDDLNILRLVGQGLQRSGYEVLTATGAEQALQINRQRPVDAVVLDNGLGAMSGIDLLAALRQESPSVAAVFTSGAITPALEESAKRFDAVTLEKPYPMRVLIERLEALLNRQ